MEDIKVDIQEKKNLVIEYVAKISGWLERMACVFFVLSFFQSEFFC